ncbi:hypothetical protein ABX013_09130 [Snodgrassella alvi]|uniref:hypothetical protein n=1 Tax=Snodgrassella alvi TaxID=1196083 RepID=UPI00352DD5A1
MDFKNLYALLNIKPTASQSNIAKAMRHAAQQQTITLDDLKLCKQYLLNEEERNKYDERLFAAYPELLAPPPEPKPEKAEEVKPLEPAKTKQGNKKLYLILVVVAAAIVLIGTVAYFKHFKPIAEAKEAVRDLLKDPDSAKFYDVKKVVNTHNKEIYVCGEMNARALAGGYAGKEKFVYELKSKKATVIPDKRPDSIIVEYYYSTLYRVGCLNTDPAELLKAMETTGDYAGKVLSLIDKRKVSENSFEREELAKSIANLSAKTKAEEQKLTIYTNSDDD